MAVIKAVSSKAGIGQALDYVTKEEKTEDKLVSGLHCEPDTVKDEMQATKELWGKTGGRTYKHFVHSYHEDEHITPMQIILRQVLNAGITIELAKLPYLLKLQRAEEQGNHIISQAMSRAGNKGFMFRRKERPFPERKGKKRLRGTKKHTTS